MMLNKVAYLQSIYWNEPEEWSLRFVCTVAIKLELEKISRGRNHDEAFSKQLSKTIKTFSESVRVWHGKGVEESKAEWKKLSWWKRRKLDQTRWIDSRMDLMIWNQQDVLKGKLELGGY